MTPEPDGHKDRVDAAVAHLKRLRETGELVIGWADGEVPPTSATKLVKAGLALVGTTGCRAGAKIYPAPR